MPGIAEFAFLLVTELAPLAIKGITSAVDAFNAGKEALEVMKRDGVDPTPEQWDVLNASIASLRTDLHTD